MWTRKRLLNIAAKYVAPLLGLGALALAVYFYFYSPSLSNQRLRASAGNKLGTRHRLAELLQDEVARQNLHLELHETAGSEQALDQINDHTLDVALVQGGLLSDGRPNVRQVLPLHLEAMHLLVKNDLYEVAAKNLGALEGKTVSLSEIGSGTHSLATEILAFAGLRSRSPDHPKGYIPIELRRQELFAEQHRDRLPDAILLMSLMPSTTARFLVMHHGYRLVPLPFGEAFALESLAPTDPEAGERHAPSPVDKGHTYPVSIPAYACSVDPPVPTKPVPTIGTRLLLVAHKDVHPQVIRRLVEATLASKAAKNGHPPVDARILELPPEFPWHDGTRLYQKRNEPVVSGALADSAQKAFAIFAAAASGLFVLWQWGKQHGHFVRDKGFSPYILRVARIEEEAMRIERGEWSAAERLPELREQLSRLKTEALERFAQGDMAGKELLAGFLAQVNDTRDYLTRLIGQRENRMAESFPPERGG
jgi:TRAP-type uncharacterized transport system substrate-binding protein